MHVQPLLPGIRHLSGEKIQWYLASELRDRIKRTGVRIQVIDRQARTRYSVIPREFTGRLLHQIPSVDTPYGEIYLEVYLEDPVPGNRVGLYRHGTRVLEDLAELDAFQRAPWTSGLPSGNRRCPVSHPHSRHTLRHPAGRTIRCPLRSALEPCERQLAEAIEEQQRAAEERASRDVLRSIHRAFREALLALPAEEYDWFEIPEGKENDKAGFAEVGTRGGGRTGA